MGKIVISDTLIYKWRYLLGYSLIIITLTAMFFIVGIYLPGGISTQEAQSVVNSNAVSFSTLMNTQSIINLPYHILQNISVTLLGVSMFSIKLPSIMLALFSSIGIIIILTKWFKPNVGILASLVAITTGPFLFIAQNGTADILYLFWPVCILLLATLVSFEKKQKLIYLIGFFIVAGLSLYTPLSLYLLASILAVTIMHPHLRCVVKRMPQIAIITGVILLIVIIVPLIGSLLANPNLINNLVGIPSSIPNIKSNILSLGEVYFGFTRPGGSTLMTPFFELGSMIIIFFGLYHVIKTRVTAKNYIIISWILCLIPLIILNVDTITITFLPLILLLSTGINTTLAYWYRLFPNNPYARIGGLIPVVALVSVLVYSGASRFVYGYEYDPRLVVNFSSDIKLIPESTSRILVSKSEFDFYKILSKNGLKFEIIDSPNGDEFLATKKAKGDFANYKINRIITSSAKNDSDRFYLYKNITE